MLVNRIFKVVLLLLAAAFVVFQSLTLEIHSAGTSALAFLLLNILYYKYTENKSKLFMGFLTLYTIAQFVGFISYFMPIDFDSPYGDFYYYFSNIFCITAYILLICSIIKKLDIRKIFAQLYIPIIILLVLDIFSLTIFSETTEHTLSKAENNFEYIYNAVVMILLSIALINYMYRNDNKSMLILIASIFIVFSEIIQFAYYYILQDNNLSFVYSFFLVLAFIFLYLQSQVQFEGPIPEYTDEIEA